MKSVHIYIVVAASLLVMAIGGVVAEPHGLQRTFYSVDTPKRSDTWGWLAFDGADYRDEDVANKVDRVTFEGVIWQPDSSIWQVVHTGGIQLQIDGETVLNIEQRQPLTYSEITVQSGWRSINATYIAGMAEYDNRGRQIQFGVYERDLFGQWQLIPSHRLCIVPSDTAQREGWIYTLTRLALVGTLVSVGVLAAQRLPQHSRIFWITAAIVLLAWLIRYILLYQRSINDPFFYYLVPGSDNYVLMARETLMGYSHLTGAFFSPGNTLWMIALTAIFGTGLSMLYIINATLGALSIGFIAGIGCEIGGKWTGIIAGLIAAIFPPLIFYHTTLQLEAMLGALLPLALWLGIRALRQPNLSTAAVFGGSVGIITLFRMTSAVIGIAFVLALFASQQVTWRRKLTLTTVASLTALLTIAPQTLANLSVGEGAPVNTNGPDTFYWGINRDGNGADVVGEAWYLTRIRRQTFTAAAVEDLRDNPLRAIELTLHKWGLLWSNTDIANNVDYQAQGLEASPLLNMLSLRGVWGAIVLLALGLTGAGLLLTEKIIPREFRLFFVAGFALFTLATIAFTVFGRMRVPLWVMLCVFAAFTLTHLLNHRVDRRLVITGAIAAALLIGVQGTKRYLPRKSFFTGEPTNATVLNTSLSDTIILIGYADLESRCGENGYVFLSLFWEVVQPHPDDQSVVLTLQDNTGNVIAQRETMIGSVSYPPIGTSQWETGARLEEKYMLLIPNDAPKSLELMATLNEIPSEISITNINCP